jgi:DNA-binding MarR family transcriptional regulator
MNEKDILNKALEILQNVLGAQETLTFTIKPSPAFGRGKAPNAIFLIEIDKDLKKKSNSARNVNKESIIGIKLTGKIFIAEVRRSTEPRFLRSSLSFFKELKEQYHDWIPLIVTPYIGPGGRELCRQEGISYIDTFGNVGIFLKDGFILKESKESIKSETRALKSLFAIKSTRVIRVLLENSTRHWKFQDLADSSKVSIGHVHNVVNKLSDEEYVTKTEQGININQPGKLLDDWAKYYKFTEINVINSFYSDERAYSLLQQKLAHIADNLNYTYAFTLFAAALLIIPYVRTPFVHFYLLGDKDKFAKNANLKPVTSGGNVSIITPYDEGVFNAGNDINGLRVVGNIQLYLDLINYPTRGKEQAEILREKVIRF